MPRALRAAVGGVVYHVLNRANARQTIFHGPQEYRLFEQILAQAHERVAMRTIGFCIMPNHWHLVLWPREDGDLSEFMRWMTVTHTQRHHARHKTVGTGHIYQGRFKAFPVQRREPNLSDRQAGVVIGANPLWPLLRYVEQNPLRAGLTDRAEQWPWGSLSRRAYEGAGFMVAGPPREPVPLSEPPTPLPTDWLDYVNRTPLEKELTDIRACVSRGCPFGDPDWVKQTAKQLGLESTLRSRGRPLTPKKGSGTFFTDSGVEKATELPFAPPLG